MERQPGQTPKPIKRSALRLRTGKAYYTAKRYWQWLKLNKALASERQAELLPYRYFSHQTPLRRKLKNVDMWMQDNKVVNLKIAAAKVDKILLRPGEVFSYWRLIGKPAKAKGYLPGMALRNGAFFAETGGGLCQLSNLIFWMTLHTPLTVTERHRHGYDVFPDADRTQPFGSGATCFYPYGDLMIHNDTQDTYQLCIRVGEEYLYGEWRVSAEPRRIYKIVEKNHRFQSEYWGGYTRHNELHQQCFDLHKNLLYEKPIIQNSAITMYSPLLPD
ncbi:MAG: VanW family protein [Firmicutes bacterium]|nr:VanW family protein [Bacillota bacterium]